MRSHANRILSFIVMPICALLAQAVEGQTITSITNAASGAAGGVSPGEIVVISGASLGPATLIAAPIADAATLPVSLGGVSVLFSGAPAPIVYASATRTAVQVPYEVSGSSSASVTVTTGDSASPAFSVPVVLTAPGLFTLNYTGAGQAVALSFGSANSTQNPAAPGSAIILFATGEGMTSPAGADGVIQSALTIRQPAQPVSVRIGGVNAPVLFTGSVPGYIPGVLEIGVLAPPNIPSNNATPVTLTIGGVTSTQLVTLAVHR